MKLEEFVEAWNRHIGPSRLLRLNGGRTLIQATMYDISHISKVEVDKPTEEWEQLTLSHVIRSLVIHVASVRLEDVEGVL